MSQNASQSGDNKAIKHEDLLQFLDGFSNEYNNSSFYDRILVFQVEDQEETRSVLKSSTSNDSVSFEEEDKSGNNVEDAEEKNSDTISINKCVNNQAYNKSLDHDKTNIKNQQSDAQFQERRIFVHSCWLSAQSSYFKALFYSGMKESHSKEVVMKVFQSELQAHLTLIEAIYKLDILNNKDYKQIVQVLVLADKYDVALVFKKCKYVLMDTTMTLGSCNFILENVQHIANCDELQDTQTAFLVREFTPLDKTWTEAKFIDLSEASLKLLLSSNNLAVQSENTVFIALMKWIECNNILPHTSSLLSLVRFELMTMDFLYDVVRDHVIGKQMVGFNQLLQQGLGYHGFSQERLNILQDKPVQRCCFINRDPDFLWVIDKKARDKLLSSPDVEISEMFWYKGYQMVIELSYGGADVNTFDIYLTVKNISTKGCLNLYWKLKSNLFKKTFSMSQIYGSESLTWGDDDFESSVSLASVSPETYHVIEVYVRLI